MYKACFIDHIVKSIKKPTTKKLMGAGLFFTGWEAALPLILGIH
jgi:hypothetical protein